GVKEHSGALVAGVTPGGPAAKAGIMDGDVILKFDGKEVTSMRGLPRLVALTPVGKDVDVEVLRKGQRLTMRVAVGRLAEDADAAKSAAKEGSSKEPPKGKAKPKDKEGKDGKEGKEGKSTRPNSGPALIGLVLAPLTDELRAKHNIAGTVNGLIVL